MSTLKLQLSDAEAEVTRVEQLGDRVTTQHDHGEISWRTFGEGAPLVLIHGGVGSWLHWIRNVEGLISHKKYRLLLPDIPGLGESDDPGDSPTPELLGAAVADGIRALVSDNEPLQIAAFSFGGIVATHAAVSLGSQAQSLVLVGASGTGLPRNRMELVRRTPQMTEEQRFACHEQNLRLLMFSPDYPIDSLARYIHDANDRQARLKSRRISMTDTLARALGHVQARLGGIWGSQDETAAPWINERRALLREVQSDAPFVELDAGHWVQYEVADAFNETLRSMLQELSV